MLALVAIVLAAPLDVSGVDAPDPCHGESPSGTFITCFDPGRGLELSVGGSAVSLSAGADLGLGLRLRGERDSKSKQDSSWLISHHVAAGQAHLSPTQQRFTVTGYEVIARRHVDDGSLLLPTNPPVRLPFPLDLGLYGRALRFDRRIDEGPGWTLETARIALMFDPLRSSSGRFHLGLGPALAHQLRFDGTTLHNELTPLTALQVFMNLESDDGRWVARLDGWTGWTFSPAAGNPGAALRAWGELSLERVLFAVNDQPVSFALHASGAYRDAGALAQNEWTAGAALKLQLFAHR